MKELAGLFSQLHSIRALVLGDLMLDKYTSGTIKRISPEAPVKILNIEKKEMKPGGAGNVVLNLLALKAEVAILGRLGFDEDGRELFSSLKAEGADVGFLLKQKGYPTITKNRLIASSQQIIRIDSEKLLALPSQLEAKVLSHLKVLIPQMQVVAISDYGKGFLTPLILKETIRLSRLHKVPVIVDPKGDDFTKYAGATILKPNQTEAYLAAKRPQNAPMEEVALFLLQETHAEKLLITRSEAGMSLFYFEKKLSQTLEEKINPSFVKTRSNAKLKLKRLDFPVRSKEVKDVTGAGDTVLATLAVAVANQLDLAESIKLANLAGGLAIERLGCAIVSLADLAGRLLEFDAKSKIFDERHLYVLEQVLKNKRYALLGVDSKAGMSNALFRALEKISQPDAKLIVYLKDEMPDLEFVRFLSHLPQIDFIVVRKESLNQLKRKIKPMALAEVD